MAASGSAPGVPTGSAADDPRSVVQRAVEEFVERCAAGDETDPVQFANGYPEAARKQIAEQCRNFLHFDDFVGRQAPDAQELTKSGVRTFGDFAIQEELGRGGMGVVYLAHQRSLNRRVALKVMASGLTLSKRHVERFRREAAAAAQLRHPGIVPVHSFTEVDGTFAFAMDYIAGRNLGEILDDLRLANGGEPGPVDGTLGLQPENGYVAECALLCAQIASALAAAHGSGIAHRDIKPRNIMIDERRQARLLDFGLAKSEGEGSISISGEITGTAHYMSPEQTLAKRVELDHRTDIFSLGVILYELLTLKRPFDGKNLQQIVYQICFQEPAPIQRLNPKVPRDLVTVCSKALEKDPHNRYQTAHEFEQDLQRFLRWEPIHARPAGLWSRASKWLHRHRTESVAAGLLLGAGLTFAGITWGNSVQARADGERLLAQADERERAADFTQAERLATQALERSPSVETRTKLELIRGKARLAATEQERAIAEANNLVAASSGLLATDRELALRAALEAVDRVDSPYTRSAVLDALGAGYRTLDLGPPRLIVRARLSADGALAATASLDGPLLICDANTGAERLRLDRRGPALDIAFHPDGQRLVSAHPDCAVVTALADGREVLRFEHIGPVESVQLDQAGARLLTVSYGGFDKGPFHARVFDLALGKELGSVTDHTRFVEIARISRDGRTVASKGDQGFVRLWDAATGKELARLPGHRARVLDLAFAPQSDLLATADADGRVRVFAVPDGALVCECRHSKAVNALAFAASTVAGNGLAGSSGQLQLLTASSDRTARLWSIDPAEHRALEVQTLIGHRGDVGGAAFDPSGLRAVTACDDGVVRVFDLASGEELKHFEFGGRIAEASFDQRGSRVLVRMGDGAYLWDLDGARATATLRQKSFVRAVAFTTDGQQVLTGNDDEYVDQWHARDGQSQPRLLPRLDKSVRALDVDPRSRRVLVATESGQIAFHNLVDGARLGALTGHTQSVTSAHFAADGERVVTASDDGTAAVWNARDNTQLCRVELHGRAVAAALSPDGTRLATIAQDATRAQLWSVPDGTPLREVGVATAPLGVALFTPDGHLLLAGDDGKARVHDAATGAVLRTLDADVRIGAAAIDRAGRKLLLCSNDKSTPVAQVWDLAQGALLLRCTSHRSALLACALSADGDYAVTSSKDRTVQVWPTDPIALARQLRPREFTAADRQKLSLPPARPPLAK